MLVTEASQIEDVTIITHLRISFAIVMANLLSCNIIEQGLNDETLWVWAFPSISKEKRAYIESNGFLFNSQNVLYGRYRSDWFYICVTECDPQKILHVKKCSLIVWARDFNVEIYYQLAAALSKTYLETNGDATKVLELYLSLVTKNLNHNQHDNGSLISKDFRHQNIHRGYSVKGLIKMFGLETVLIYNALLLKTKLIVYHHCLPILLEWLLAIIGLMNHRKFDDKFIPWFDISEENLYDLKTKPFFLAGCTDNSVFSKNMVYDILVNIPAKEITIAPHAKEKFTMTKVHKEIALYMQQLLLNDVEEEKLLSGLSKKTKELIQQMMSLTTTEGYRNVLCKKSLEESNFSSGMENFIIQLAIAEGVQLS